MLLRMETEWVYWGLGIGSQRPLRWTFFLTHEEKMWSQQIQYILSPSLRLRTFLPKGHLLSTSPTATSLLLPGLFTPLFFPVFVRHSVLGQILVSSSFTLASTCLLDYQGDNGGV